MACVKKFKYARFFFCCAAILALVACGSGGGSSGGSNTSSSSSSSSSGSSAPSNFDYTGMFANLSDEIFIPTYTQFANNAAEFASDTGALNTYCESLGTQQEANNLASARSSWTALMLTWQKAEVFQFGPVTDNSSRDRNVIHGYGKSTGLDTCLVDRNVIRAESEGFDISEFVNSSRGLGTLEYLLFNENLEHTCAANETETQAWNARPAGERQVARCNYAKLAASDMSNFAASILSDWTAQGDNFRTELVQSANPEEFLQGLSDAIFYIEKVTKDIKLGIVTGIKQIGSGDDFCANAACPERVEFPYSTASLESIKTNLETFWDIYTGNEGSGFDDIISAAGMPQINQSFETDVTAAIEFVDSMIQSDTNLLDQAQTILSSAQAQQSCANSNSNPEAAEVLTACALHGLTKRISDRLRTDFILAVQVDLPAGAQADND